MIESRMMIFTRAPGYVPRGTIWFSCCYRISKAVAKRDRHRVALELVGDFTVGATGQVPRYLDVVHMGLELAEATIEVT